MASAAPNILAHVLKYLCNVRLKQTIFNIKKN